jgi:predicted GTPase
VLNALEESDVIYFIVSSRDGVIGLDREIAIQLRKLKKDIVLVCNKAEGLQYLQLPLPVPPLLLLEVTPRCNQLNRQSLVRVLLEESDVIYFIVSSRDGVIGLDREIAIQLRKLKKDIVLVCNKAEGTIK